MIYEPILRPAHILIVEDNPDDVDLTLEALRSAKLSVSISVVDDGMKALQFLKHTGEYANATIPDLILLDLNLPKINGREVLTRIKADEDLRRIPVVILTTSNDEMDILAAYDSHANAYLTKPVDFQEFIKIVNMVEDFWLTLVKLPPRR
jgi:two-component system response regulator